MLFCPTTRRCSSRPNCGEMTLRTTSGLGQMQRHRGEAGRARVNRESRAAVDPETIRREAASMLYDVMS